MFTPQLLRKCEAAKAVREVGFGTSFPFVLLIDFDALRQTLQYCKDSFPAHWLHCFAVKANATRLVLMEVKKAGFGLEVASIGELRMAGRATVPPLSVVYDSPLKPRSELMEALATGVVMNIDNFQELEVVSELIADYPNHGPIGIRVNPQVGSGSLSGYSTGSLTAKFGVGLRDHGGVPLIEVYKKYPWLTAIMCHVGSQGIPFDLAIQGIRETVDFALKINQLTNGQITSVDIGGGLSVNFSSDVITPTFGEYSAQLKAKVPELFDPQIFPKVYTEFGRSIINKTGFFASKIEYVKETGGRRIAVQYAGADTCVRTVYFPKDWPLRTTIIDPEGNPRGGDGVDPEYSASLPGGIAPTDLAGPCCIQADIIAHQQPLPPLRREDVVLIHDVGGYYHSGHTRYNLRQNPGVYAFENGPDGSIQVKCLQPAETVDSTLDAFCDEEYLAANKT